MIAAYSVETSFSLLRYKADVLSVIFDPIPFFVIVSAVALLMGRLWGWWLALITDLLWAAVLIYGMVDTGWQVDGITTASGIIPVLLLPSVRKFYFKGTNIRPVRL